LSEFFGTLHCHSTFSRDGFYELDELARRMKRKGFSFLLMTEHQEDMDQRAFARFVTACDQAGGDDFLMVPGLEFHEECLIFLGLREMDFSLDHAARLKQAADAAAVIAMVHPNRLAAPVGPALLARVRMVEIWNVKYHGARLPDWDCLQYWRRSPQLARRPFFFGLDMHQPKHLQPLGMVVALDELTEPKLLAALYHGRFAPIAKGAPWSAAELTAGRRAEIWAYSRLREAAKRVKRLADRLLPAAAVDWLTEKFKGMDHG